MEEGGAGAILFYNFPQDKKSGSEVSANCYFLSYLMTLCLGFLPYNMLIKIECTF